MTNTLYCHDVTFAARLMREWVPFVEPWAADAIKRALSNVVEYRRTPGSDSDDIAPLPLYSVNRVKAAIKHVEKIEAKMERELERFTPTKGKKF